MPWAIAPAFPTDPAEQVVVVLYLCLVIQSFIALAMGWMQEREIAALRRQLDAEKKKNADAG